MVAKISEKVERTQYWVLHLSLWHELKAKEPNSIP